MGVIFLTDIFKSTNKPGVNVLKKCNLPIKVWSCLHISAMHKDTSGKNTNGFEIECIFFNSIKSTDCWWNDQQRNCIYLTFCKDISTKLDALLCMHYLKLMHAGLWYTLIVHFVWGCNASFNNASLIKKKIEKKTKKKPRTRLPVEGNGFPVFVMAHLLTFSWHEKYQNR